MQIKLQSEQRIWARVNKKRRETIERLTIQVYKKLYIRDKKMVLTNDLYSRSLYAL